MPGRRGKRAVNCGRELRYRCLELRAVFDALRAVFDELSMNCGRLLLALTVDADRRDSSSSATQLSRL